MKIQALFHPLSYFVLAFAIVTVLAGATRADGLEPGKAAPDFTATDINGAEVTLSKLKGKIVVLEWNNPECPFVKKHYGAGNMQKTQKYAADKGVVWISVNSGADGKQGHLTPKEANAMIGLQKAKPAHYIIDDSGKIGHMYGAKTTPHMFVIDSGGKIAYMGAIDSIASADPADIQTADNHVIAAIDALADGKEPAVTQTQPYGCSVKYAD